MNFNKDISTINYSTENYLNIIYKHLDSSHIDLVKQGKQKVNVFKISNEQTYYRSIDIIKNQVITPLENWKPNKPVSKSEVLLNARDRAMAYYEDYKKENFKKEFSSIRFDDVKGLLPEIQSIYHAIFSYVLTEKAYHTLNSIQNSDQYSNLFSKELMPVMQEISPFSHHPIDFLNTINDYVHKLKIPEQEIFIPSLIEFFNEKIPIFWSNIESIINRFSIDLEEEVIHRAKLLYPTPDCVFYINSHIPLEGNPIEFNISSTSKKRSESYVSVLNRLVNNAKKTVSDDLIAQGKAERSAKNTINSDFVNKQPRVKID